MECSNWATRLPSIVRSVQPSSPSTTSSAVGDRNGSIARTSPSRKAWQAGFMAMRSWPADWELRFAGAECSACSQGRPDEDEYGVRYFAGSRADAYLQRSTPVPGHSTVVFRGRHVADPIDLTPDETVAFWSDVRIAARAIQTVFAPCHLNYQLLGNAMPHVHVHVIPRYLHDSAPGRPLGDDVWNSATVVPSLELDDQVVALKSALRASIENH